MTRLVLRALASVLAVVLGASIVGEPAARAADTPSRPFLLDRGSVEVLFAQGGWRSGVSTADNNPGFSVLGGGGELVLGIYIIPGVGVVADGRTFVGPRLNGVYVEGLGGVGLQLRVSDWVRVRIGAAAGQGRLDRNGLATDSAVLVGGFLAASIDLVSFLHERAAAVIVLRFDADGHVDRSTGTTFSQESIALSVGLGFRF